MGNTSLQGLLAVRSQNQLKKKRLRLLCHISSMLPLLVNWDRFQYVLKLRTFKHAYSELGLSKSVADMK